MPEERPVEGLYLLSRAGEWEHVSREFDEHWYLDTPLDLALDRLVQRHQAAWGVSREQAEARVAANDRLNAETVFETRWNADWTIPHGL